MTCGAEGTRSLLALCHSEDLETSGCPDEPVMAHVTVCPKHLAGVRVWLRNKSEDGEVITVGTAKLLARWDQVHEHHGLPVWGTARGTG